MPFMDLSSRAPPLVAPDRIRVHALRGKPVFINPAPAQKCIFFKCFCKVNKK